MRRISKLTAVFLLSFFIITCFDSCRKKGGAYNPYLHQKTKPSQQLNKENKRILRKQKRLLNKQQGDNRKHLFGRRKPPKA